MPIKVLNITTCINTSATIQEYINHKNCQDYVLNLSEIQEYNFLKDAEYNSIPFLSLKGAYKLAKCVKLYDGDTGTFVLFFKGFPYKFRVRFAGIDTAEIKSKDPIETVVANRAKRLVLQILQECNNLCYLECHDFDKYGRLLATIYANGSFKSINQILIDNKLAYPYSGQKRTPFKQWYYGENTVKDDITDLGESRPKDSKVPDKIVIFTQQKTPLYKRIFGFLKQRQRQVLPKQRPCGFCKKYTCNCVYNLEILGRHR